MELKTLNFKTDFFMPTLGRFMSGFIAVVGLIAIFTNGIIGVFIALFGLLLVTLRHGVVLDDKQQRFKKYINVLGYKHGQWKSLEDYPYLAVLSATEVSIINSLSNRHGAKSKVYRVTLLNHNHRERLKIAQFKNEQEADDLTTILASALPLQKTIFSPH